MYCQVCNKKTATVHFTELAGGKKIEVHVCRECADEKGLLLDSGGYGAQLWAHAGAGVKGDSPPHGRTCVSCGMAYSDFKSSGRLGCCACYESFKTSLAGIIRRIHGAGLHAGKSPELSGSALKMRMLSQHRKKLRELVSQEKFEEASRIRDIIKSLEK